jgi:hypothetical protein
VLRSVYLRVGVKKLGFGTTLELADPRAAVDNLKSGRRRMIYRGLEDPEVSTCPSGG